MNRAACIPHAALFSLVTPSCPLYYYYLIYITCIIRNQYNPLFFLHIIPEYLLNFVEFPGRLVHLEFRLSSPGLQVYLVQICKLSYGSGGVHLESRSSPGVQEFTWSPVEST